MNPSKQSPYDVWSELAAARGVTAPPTIFECVGAGGLLQEIVDACPMGSKIYAAGGWYTGDSLNVTHATKKLLMIQFGGAPGADDWYGTLDAIVTGRLDPRPSIGMTVGLDGLPDAIDLARRRKVHPGSSSTRTNERDPTSLTVRAIVSRPFERGPRVAVITVGGTMDAKARAELRTSRAVGRVPWRMRIVALIAVLAAVAVSFGTAGASTKSAAASGPVVKVGMITALTGPIASNPGIKDTLLAAVAAFNKRGGVGTTHAKMQADVCDSHGDANGEVACARQMVDDGVVATLDDLTYNNPAGVVDILQGAGIPRIGIGGTDVSEFHRVSRIRSRPGSSRRTSVPQSGSSRTATRRSASCGPTRPPVRRSEGFLTPMFTAVGIDISCDVAVATGATDYAPYIAQVQQENPDAVLISHSDSVTTQLIGAMAQLNAKIPLGGAPGSFTIETLRKYKDHHEGHGPLGFVPVPLAGERQELPRAQAVLRRHEGVGQDRASARRS